MPDRQAGGPLFVCCPQLLIQDISSHTISGGHLHPQLKMCQAMVMDPLIMDVVTV